MSYPILYPEPTRGLEYTERNFTEFVEHEPKLRLVECEECRRKEQRNEFEKVEVKQHQFHNEGYTPKRSKVDYQEPEFKPMQEREYKQEEREYKHHHQEEEHDYKCCPDCRKKERDCKCCPDCRKHEHEHKCCPDCKRHEHEHKCCPDCKRHEHEHKCCPDCKRHEHEHKCCPDCKRQEHEHKCCPDCRKKEDHCECCCHSTQECFDLGTIVLLILVALIVWFVLCKGNTASDIFPGPANK